MTAKLEINTRFVLPLIAVKQSKRFTETLTLDAIFPRLKSNFGRFDTTITNSSAGLGFSSHHSHGVVGRFPRRALPLSRVQISASTGEFQFLSISRIAKNNKFLVVRARFLWFSTLRPTDRFRLSPASTSTHITESNYVFRGP